MMDDMYREHILDHYQNPRNCEELKSCAISTIDHNPLCGDKVQIFADIKGNKLKKMTFKGSGCAISLAATSMLSEEVVGKPIQQIRKLDQQYIQDLLGIDIGVARMKCAMLGLRTLQKGIAQYLATNN